MARKPFVCVDLDGTLAEYDGWRGEDHIGDPVPNACSAMQLLRDQGCEIAVWTTRGNADVVRSWLERHQVPFDYINQNPSQPEGTSEKLIAHGYIDDRAYNGKQLIPAVLEFLASIGKRVYSDGRIDGGDDGDIHIAIAADPKNGIVRIEFGKELKWLGLPKQQALALAKAIMQKASQL